VRRQNTEYRSQKPVEEGGRRKIRAGSVNNPHPELTTELSISESDPDGTRAEDRSEEEFTGMEGIRRFKTGYAGWAVRNQQPITNIKLLSCSSCLSRLNSPSGL
jgi:hypothetical protein